MENAVLAARLADLSPSQREELLKKIRQFKGKKYGAAGSMIKPVARQEFHPLSFSQQRLWFLDRLEGSNLSYNMPAMFKVDGQLNVEALGSALQAITERHEILRTSFHDIDGCGYQKINASIEHALTLVDLSSISEDERNKAEAQEVKDFFSTSFDLVTVPLFHVHIIKRTGDLFSILFKFHHVIFDAWSVKQFSSELAHFYNSFCRNEAPTLNPLAIQYVDYSVWQRELLTDKCIHNEMAFWKAYLDDLPELQLPLDFRRPEDLNHEGDRIYFDFPYRLSKQIQETSRQQGVTTYTSLLAIFMLLCSRYSRQDDIVIGTPVANREYAELEDLLGFLVNSLVIRQQLSSTDSFSQLLQQLQNNLRQVWQHQTLPLEVLVDEMDVKREKNKTPLFQHMFVWHGDDELDLSLDGLAVTPTPVPSQTAKFDLTLTMSEAAEGLRGEIEYRSACFKRETITAFARHYSRLAEQVVRSSDLPLREFSLLTAAEINRQINFNGNSKLSDWEEPSLVSRFEKQVERFPQNIAICDGDKEISYQELNDRANQLAYKLRACDVIEASRVGLSMQRSVDLITAIIAILKCGAAYVPIDPASPSERKRFILEDANVHVVLSDESVRDSELALINFDATKAELSDYPKQNLNIAIAPETRAYMIYTSGTTGNPKGVPIQHGNVLRLFSQSAIVFDFSENDCWTLFHSYAFDFSVWEIWGALLYGGKLVLVSEETSREPQQFYQLLIEEQVTVLNQTPSAFNQIISVDREQAEKNLSLRYVVFGGEALEFQNLKPWVERYGFNRPQLVNMYGITETTVHVTSHCLGEQDFTNPISNIGRPLPDLEVYLFDDNMQFVPVGVTGEMYVTGRGLSEGYWQRPELNKERFIEKEINGETKRLYRSGDLAHYNKQGELIYSGRNDEQVKIRGYRVELGDINAKLKACQHVSASAVLSDEEQSHLVAFVVLSSEKSENILTAIREQLASQLPQYMVPGFIYICNELPLTQNGKLDKKQLLLRHENEKVKRPSVAMVSSHVAPRNQNEKILAGIWCDVLGVDWVGVHDNFFEIGGDSILSLQIVSRAKKAGMQLSAKQLFEHQTIAKLALVSERELKHIVAPQEMLRGEIQLNPIQSWFFEQVDANKIKVPNYWNQSLLFRIKQPVSVDKLKCAWLKIINKHDQLRCRFKNVEGKWLAYFHEEEGTENIIHECHIDSDALATTVAEFESGLDIHQGPLQQLVLLHCEKQVYLFITVHHLLIDAVSWRILLDDLLFFLDNEKAEFGPKTSAFSDVNEAVLAKTESGTFDNEMEYWSKELVNAETIFSRKNGRQTNFDKRTIRNHLEPAFVALLNLGAKNYNSDMATMLLLALLLNIQKTCKKQQLRIDLENYGRDVNDARFDLSQTVGWFTAIYPQSFSLPEYFTIGDALLYVKEKLQQIPAQGVNYGWLALAKKCDSLASTPGEVLFNYLGQVTSQPNEIIDLDDELELQQVDPQNAPGYPLEVNAYLKDEQLYYSLSYDLRYISKDMAKSLLDGYNECIQQIAIYAVDQGRFAYSPSDFPLVNLSQQQFQYLTEKLTSKDQSRELEAVYPLSPMQEGMLFHALHDDSGETYFEQIYVEIKGTINFSALQGAWEKVVAKHAILRTGFYWEELPRAFQFVKKSVRNPVLSVTDDSHTTQALKSALANERKQGFDLCEPSLIRLRILENSKNNHYLIFSFHHLILDGWSVSLVLSDLFNFYQRMLNGESLDLAVGPDYEKYIHFLSQQDHQAAKDFWAGQLADFERATPLPSVNSGWKEINKPQRDQLYLTEITRLSGDLTQELEKFCKRHHLTLNTLFLGAWAYLLSRYAGEEKVTFGTTVSGRPAQLAKVEQSAGMFINTLPLSVQVPEGVVDDDTYSIIRWLEGIQQQSVSMRPWEFISLSELQRFCGLSGGEHLFESIVVFENYPVDQALSSSQMPFEVGEVNAVWKTNFPLTLIFLPGEQITMKISYQGDLFRHSAIQNLMRQFQLTLENFLEKSDKPVQEISLLSKAERVRMLQIWNQSARTYPSESNVGAEFDNWAQALPQHPALCFNNELISYEVLNKRANQLAHYLIAEGVQAESVVAFCGERSVEMIVSLLAIVKAGGAYLALDPNYPDERNRYMLDDSRVSILLCTSSQQERFYDLQIPVVNAETDFSTFAMSTPDVSIRAEQLALVIYTSGSTGQPKGIELTHRNVLRLVKNSNVVAFRPEDRVLHYAPIAFDAATWEIWGALLNGARLVMVPSGNVDADQMGDLIARQHVSHAFFTTALFHSLVEFNPQLFAPLQVLMTGGEVVNVERVRALFADLPRLRFINLYGPSENTTLSTWYAVSGGNFDVSPVPIGYPVSNTQVYILDRNLQPLPAGMVGELCVAGDGVARGYRFNPELSRQAFVANPFAKVYGHGSVLYRTGDMARYRSDGAVEFLGRRDQQVKIRGHRIELGEVEAAIQRTAQHMQDCGLRNVVVRASKSERATHLIAWVVLEKEASLPLLKDSVSQRLPAYMAPTYWVCLDTLPLTANGKVDYRALPEPQNQALPQRLPSNEQEKKLAKIWSTLLGMEQVGVNDNFFALGGDSILSIQVVSRAKRAGIGITTKQLFENPTIAKLVKVAGSSEGLIAQQDSVTERAMLSPIQNWFFEQAFEAPQHWNMSLLLKPVSTDGESLPQLLCQTKNAVRALVTQHDMLRAIYPEAGPSYLPLDWQLPQMQSMISVAQVAKADLYAAVNRVQESLDLSNGPLFKAVWFDMGDEARFLIVAHHLIMDGVSWRILLEDLSLAIKQQQAQQAIDFGRKTTAFAHWSQRLWQYAQEEAVQAQKRYWLHQAQSTVSRIEPDLVSGLSAAQMLEKNLAKYTRSQSFTLNAEQTELLLRQVPKAYLTETSDLLLLALVETLNHIHAQQGQVSESQLIALEGHGREYLGEQYDTSRTVGWFTTLYPVLLSAEGNNWGEKIKALKQQLREIPVNGLGYGLLSYLKAHVQASGDICDVETAFRKSDQAQVSFNYLGQTVGLFGENDCFEVAQESPGEERASSCHQPYLLDVAGLIHDAGDGPQLKIMWRYSEQLFSETLIKSWVDFYRVTLESLVGYCTNRAHQGRVPADFPLLSLSQQNVDDLLPDPRLIEDMYPLSPLQSGLWFHHKLMQGQGSYLEQHVMSLEGELDKSLLEEAWQQITMCHSIFRTAFVESNDQVVQRLDYSVKVPFKYFKATEIDLPAFLGEDRLQDFDFACPPLMRVAIVSSGEFRHDMVWTFHHILLDGWSVVLVLSDLLQCYRRLCADGEPIVAPAAPPYRDYIQWLNEQDEQQAKDYWQNYLQGISAPTPLPCQKHVSSEKRPDNDLKPTICKQLSSELTEKIFSFSQRHQITANTLFQGAWAYLLSAYSGEEDVVFGVTVSGRPAELNDIEKRVGLFINSMPMRVQLEGNTSIVTWLQTLQDQQTRSRAYEYLPLFTIQGLSECREELFQSLFVFENYPIDKALAETPSALKIIGSQSIEQTHYPMTLVVLPGKQFGIQLNYDDQQFPEEHVERLLCQMSRTLEEFLERTSLEDISLIEQEDLNKIKEWNQTHVRLSDTDTVISLIHSHVLLSPSSLALEESGEQVTFQQLDQQANQFAHYLCEQGLTKEDAVALVANRGISATRAMLAILKAGGVMLPIDPAYPEERIAMMLDDSQAKFICIAQEYTSCIKTLEKNKTIILEHNQNWQHCDLQNPSTTIDQKQLAYLVYTSGSTGKPKAVQIEHRALLNYCQWAKRYMSMSTVHRHSVLAGFSFDASFMEIFPSLISGASIHFMPEKVKLNPEEHMVWFAEKEISHAFLPTTLAEQFIQQTPLANLNLRFLMVGGDKLLRSPLPNLPYNIINAYGPSEATIVSTAGIVNAEGKELPSIGSPIDNVHTYLLGKNKKPVPIGVEGEIYIGGENLAREYLNRAELTEEKFINVYIEGIGDERLYATGDKARYRDDGQLEFLGRVDNQIKIRGVRIEPGEIEACLIQQRGVEQAAVVPIHTVKKIEGAQQEGFVAYLKTSCDVDSDLLRFALLKFLPEIMVPKFYHVLEEFPLTPNGKVDRKSMPVIDFYEARENFFAPESEEEIKLAQLWQQVLGVEKIGRYDNFFALGGHSLLATKVHNRMRDVFNLEIPLRTLFEVATLNELARIIQTLADGLNEPDTTVTEECGEDEYEEGSF